jgi:hypothetical protein
MSRSPTGHGSWMPASIAGDTWPGVLATTLRSDRTSGLPVPLVSERRVLVRRADENLDSMRTYCSAGEKS